MHNPKENNLLNDAQTWQSFCKQQLTGLAFDELKKEYDKIFSSYPFGIAWLPDEDTITHANLSALAHKLNLKNYQELYRWSIENREDYWNEAIKALNVEFDQPYQQIIETPVQDLENPDWLPQAKLNIARSCLKASPEKTAIICSDENQKLEKISYQELQTKCNQVSNGLTKLGFRPGDRIALYLPLCPEAVYAYLGIIQAGMVAVLIADSFSAHELKRRLASSEAKAIIAYDEYSYAGKALPVYPKIKEAQAPTAIIINTQNETETREEDILWQDFLASDTFNVLSATPDSLISILFSSGTTNEPKAIPWTQLTPIKCAADAHFHQDVQPKDVVSWTTGMGWMMGPWTIFAALMNKATLALFTGSAATPAFADFAEKANISILGTIPSLVKAWRKNKTMENRQLSIRLFSSTGEPSQVEDYLYLMWLAQFKAPIIEYCGGTEIGGGYISGSVLQAASPATFTTPTLGTELLFRNEENGQITHSQDGEVFIVPPAIGLSQHLLNRDHHKEYYEDTPQTADGTLLRKHGDSYQVFDQLLAGTTFYKSRGRADDSMNLGGIKISAVEIEKIVNQHPQVYESAAVAVAPKGGGPEALIIFFIPKSEVIDLPGLKTEWQALISKELNPLFRIKEIIPEQSLPRTASNKLMRRSLRKAYMQQQDE
ncbi:AMP-binding protein [Porifericola rhodea]|uniref:AMP-binding protein n=1 Tax=Porifericola rhodea TaxID=930972 RepID=UPI002666EC03|nr:AMP-binding protein [Porifericola rhodea]WKN30569.1 AMP-binding protein [Porifericola rhodea]